MENYDKELCEIVSSFYEKSKTEDEISEDTIFLVKRWQKYLSNEHYECTDEMLECLGKMYPSEEFKGKIDVFGQGTADFMSRAILEYCKRKKTH
jgi:hypothetical protein